MSLFLENEKLIFEARKHSFYFYAHVTGVSIIAILPLLIHRITIIFVPIEHSVALISFLLFFYALYLLIPWIYAFVTWTDYSMDAWFVTDSRVVDFELKGLFKSEVASVNLSEIQDIKVEVNGIIENMLKIGDVHIQTAGASKEFVINGIANPAELKNKILEAKNVYKR
ncbi:MAG: PH domain-containing protein [Candidatus Pacebacteria bacterium]|nr:PH domain-containing protein [Candidatus Paceibacterota bacterium]MCF7862765.1 PH domain-containing protein [Candidatus Paceibacterota bacterium]